MNHTLETAGPVHHKGGGRLGVLHGAQRLAGPAGHGDHDGGRSHHGGGGQYPSAVHIRHEGGDVVVGGIGEDLFGRSDLNDAAIAHHGHSIAKEHRLVEIVRDEHDGLAQGCLKLDELFLHLAANQGIQGRERLVHQQDVGIGRQGARQPNPLTHSA